MTKRSHGIVEDFDSAKKQKTMNNGTHIERDDGQEIDEDLHSRQLAVYGRESMRRLMQANVLIVGALGLGAEIGELPRSGKRRQGRLLSRSGRQSAYSALIRNPAICSRHCNLP